MEAFQWISVILSLVLGLGITRLLSSAVAVFRSRDCAPVDWIPLVWGACVFLWQIQFWWAIIELSEKVIPWTPLQFLALLGLPLTLFVAAALVLPPTELRTGESLSAEFERDGRWALLFLSAYFFLAIGENWYFWNVAPQTRPGLINLILALIPLVFLSTTSRKSRRLLTILYLLYSLFAAWIESPHAY
jgi:hypothetical protein